MYSGTKMLRRNLHFLSSPSLISARRFSSSAAISSFAEFHEGSRPCTLRTATATNAVAAQEVMLVPIAHAATPAFYDKGLGFLAMLRNKFNSHEWSAFTIVVEGASENQMERQMETDEMALISRHVQAVEAHRAAGKGDEDISGNPDLLESANFVAKFTKLIESGSIYSQAHLKSICDMYRLPFPLPNGLVLQDAYFRPRLSFAHGDCIVNGDVIVSELPDPQIAVADPVRFHAAREAHCVQTVLKVLQEQQQQQQTEEEGEKLIVVLWGHFHCPRLLQMLQQQSHIEFAEPEFSKEVQSYGWSREMMKEIYGV